MILEKIKKYWKILLVGIVILVVICFAVCLKKEKVSSLEEDVFIMEPVVENEKEVEYVYVDIKGAVKKPGVYKLEEGSRVIDVISKSGGLQKDADTSVINLSKKLEDGNVIIIYTKNKIEELKEQEKIVEYIEKECVCPDTNNDACLKEEDIIVEQPEVEQSTTSKVSLNNATLEELMTLPGIGESKAQDILDYRNIQGNFKVIEDIKNVKGIGDALFEKIKDYITI